MKIESATKIKKPGEHAVKVRNLRLFHLDQTAALSAAEKKQALADLEAKKAKRATSDVLPKPSPVQTPVAPKAKAAAQPAA